MTLRFSAVVLSCLALCAAGVGRFDVPTASPPVIVVPDLSTQSPQIVSAVAENGEITLSDPSSPSTTSTARLACVTVGPEMIARVRELLIGETVYRTAPVATSPDSVMLWRAPENLCLNAELVRIGLAKVSDDGDSETRAKLAAYQEIASKHGRGMWSSSASMPAPKRAETPSQPAKQQVTVYATKLGSKYHTAGCSYARKSGYAISLEQAKAKGLDPCSRCNPPR